MKYWILSLIALVNLQTAQGQEFGSNLSAENWPSKMAVSLNGKLPSKWYYGENWEKKHWHESFSSAAAARKAWKGNDFFDDNKVADLCDAIFEADLVKIEKLIRAGADVNKVGKGGMNALYWAYHLETDPRPFGLLLKFGANPNVIVKGIRSKPLVARAGLSVAHLTMMSGYNRHFKNVFENGGDPSVEEEMSISGNLPALRYFWNKAPDAEERLLLLIANGADVSRVDQDGASFLSSRVSGGTEIGCKLVLIGLRACPEYTRHHKQAEKLGIRKNPFGGCYFRLIHYLAAVDDEVQKRPKEKRKHYTALVNWFEQRGESLQTAKEDLVRWKKWKAEGKANLIEKEHKERIKTSDSKGQ